MPITQKNRVAAIGTPLGEDVLCLKSFSGSEQLGRLFQFELELLSENHNIDFDDIIGKNVTIRLELPDDKTRYFNGYVSRFVQTPSEDHGRYQATVVPWLWFLTRTADCRIFQDKTIPQIIEEVFKGHGFDGYELGLKGTYQKWPYCVQYRETDFNFVSRLMEQEGIYYFFKHDNGSHKLVLTDSPGTHEDFPDYETIVFRPPGSTGVATEHISDWVIHKELQTGTYAHTDFNFEKPKTNLQGKSSIPRQHANADFEVFDYPGEYEETKEGEDYAKIRIQEIQSHYETIHGQSDARGICAGYTFTLDEHPRDDQNRKYLVCAASHSIEMDVFESGGSGGGDFYHCSFSVIDATTQFRSARITPKPIIQGLQTAIVVGPKGEEIYTDKYGRVKVQFHWDRYGKADENSSCWVRVAQLWAGKKWGAMYIPRIGQEVMVEFLEGDPDWPIITGRVYNADAMPPYDLPGEKTKSTLKSLSTKGGGGFNEIRFEDKKGEEQIFIHGQRNMDVRVRNNLKETVYGNREVRVGWEKDGATGGSLNSLVKLDVNTHIKGGQYEQIEKDLNQTVQGVVIENYQKDHNTNVEGVQAVNANEIIVETSDAISQKTGTLALEGSQEVGVKGGAVNVESSDGISLKCGGNFVTIDASGVAINGTMVMINSGGAAKPAAAAKEAIIPALETPLEARIADDGKPGLKSHGPPGKPRQRGKITPTHKKAPPWKPPPPTTGPVAPGGAGVVSPPVTDAPVVCAGPYKLTDPEKEGERKANEKLILEVVPASLLSGDVVFAKSTGKCDCAGALVTIGEHNYALNAPAKVEGWSVVPDDMFGLITILYDVTPKELPVRLTCGRNKSAIGDPGTIYIYPCNTISIKVESDEIFKKCPNVESAFDGLMEILAKITGHTYVPEEGIEFGSGIGEVKIAKPKLSMGYEAQWKEYKAGSAEEWRAYYAWKLNLGVTISIEFKLDVLGAAVACTGVGAPVVEFAKRVQDWLGQKDPLIYFAVKSEIGGGGICGYEVNYFGGFEIKGTGTFSIGAGINIPGKVEANVQGCTALSSSITGKGSKAGPVLTYECLKWSGIQGKAHIKFKCGDFFSIGMDVSVQLIDGAGPLWHGTIPKGATE